MVKEQELTLTEDIKRTRALREGESLNTEGVTISRKNGRWVASSPDHEGKPRRKATVAVFDAYHLMVLARGSK
jgi:hypothetical protein